ncbi:major facilitator superfamily domain-containing protein [Coniochaeta sp. 2T2.1]|nr:major facilitator superfamily domain-containing protein [Coniochaeta sp. 2T2.1]
MNLDPRSTTAMTTSRDRGLRPWLTVWGSFCLTVATHGLLSAIGLFQTYWRGHQLAGDYSDSSISWIPSMFGFLACFFASPAGVLFDLYGSSVLLPVSSAVYLLSFLGLAWSATYAQFMACFVVAGIAAAGPTTVAFSVVGHWFRVRRGLALGLVTVGAAFGGIFFSLLLKALFGHQSLSWRDAILVLSAILACLLATGVAFVRKPAPKRGGVGSERVRVDLSCFLSGRFWLLCYTVWVYELVLFVQWGSIPTYSVTTGLGDPFYLMVGYNIGAIVGSSVPPWLADRWFGPLNATIIMNIFSILVVFALRLPVGGTSAGALFAVVVLMGITTGSSVPLSAACVMTLCEPGKVGTWLGSTYTVVGFATLVGNPITLAILDNWGAAALVGFLGGMLCTGLATALAVRWVCLERRWTWLTRV